MADNRIKRLEKQIEAIVIAIPREEAANEYYLDLAELSDDEGQKEIYMYLAKQELKHKIKLEEILEKLEKELAEEVNKNR